FNDNYVGTEHLLLGLIKLGEGVAVNVLQKMGLDLERVRMELEKHVGPHPATNMVGNIPSTPRVKKVLALAGKEAKALNHSFVGTEHILLGLLREGEGVAARVLKSLEVDPARTRSEILKELDPNFIPPESEAQSGQEGTKKDVNTPALRTFGRTPIPDSQGRSANRRRSGSDFERLAPEVREPSQSQAYRPGAGSSRSAFRSIYYWPFPAG